VNSSTENNPGCYACGPNCFILVPSCFILVLGPASHSYKNTWEGVAVEKKIKKYLHLWNIYFNLFNSKLLGPPILTTALIAEQLGKMYTMWLICYYRNDLPVIMTIERHEMYL